MVKILQRQTIGPTCKDPMQRQTAIRARKGGSWGPFGGVLAPVWARLGDLWAKVGGFKLTIQDSCKRLIDIR